MIEILLVDDQHLLREGLKMVLEADPELRVVAQAGTAVEALERLGERSYDVLLIDLSLPDMDGTRLIQLLRQQGCDRPVLVVSMHRAEAIVEQAMAAGAQGYLLKSASPQALRQAVHEVAGQTLAAPATPVPPSLLSPSQRELLFLYGRATSLAQIGEQLGYSAPTLASHSRALCRKLGVDDLAAALARAVELGIILPDPHGSEECRSD